MLCQIKPAGCTQLDYFRLGFQILLVGAFFAIWYGPGKRKIGWLAYTLFFAVETLHYGILVGTAAYGLDLCIMNNPSLGPVLLSAVLTLSWMLLLLWASYRWFKESPNPIVMSLAAFAICAAHVALYLEPHLGWWWCAGYMVVLLPIIAYRHWLIGGPLLSFTMAYAGGLGAIRLQLYTEMATKVEQPIVNRIALTVEMASVSAALILLVLFLNHVSRQRDEFEDRLATANRIRRAVILNTAGDPLELKRLASVAEGTMLHGTRADH